MAISKAEDPGRKESDSKTPKSRKMVSLLVGTIRDSANGVIDHFHDTTLDTLQSDAKIAIDHLRYTTQKRTADVSHRERLPLIPYDILKPAPESLAKWKIEVDAIIKAIKANDLGKFGNQLKKRDGRYCANPQLIINHIQTENYDEHSIVLTAIGLFILREKSGWGKGPTRLKVLAGGRVKMEDLLTAEGYTNCIDAAAIAREIATLYGINGEIKKIINPPHGYFLSDQGKVLDSFYGNRHGGVFKTFSDYKKFTNNLPFKDKFGIDISKILPI